MKYLIISVCVLCSISIVILLHSGTLRSTNTGGLSAAVPMSSEVDPRSTAAVQTSMQSHIMPGDQTKLYATVISEDYALQSWGDSDIGGQALLKYNTDQQQWNLLTWGGGTWSVEELVQSEGVPRDTATALVAGMQQ